jgi:hypothetical protein
MEDAAVTHDSLVLSLAAGPDARVPDTMPDVTALYAVSARWAFKHFSWGFILCLWRCLLPRYSSSLLSEVHAWSAARPPTTGYMLAQQALCPCTQPISVFHRLQVFDGHCGSHAADFASSRILEGVTGHTRFPVDIPATLVRRQLNHF